MSTLASKLPGVFHDAQIVGKITTLLRKYPEKVRRFAQKHLRKIRKTEPGVGFVHSRFRFPKGVTLIAGTSHFDENWETCLNAAPKPSRK